MKVKELLHALHNVDEDSTVLFLAEHADADDADEICEIHIPSNPWTHEVGRCDGSEYRSRYPYPAEKRDEGYTSVSYAREKVVVLSTGPTNLRFVRTEHMPPVFEPDEDQQESIDKALAAHRRAQANGIYAPDRLVEKWSSEVGFIPAKHKNSDTPRKRHGRLRGAIAKLITLLTRF
ncbi:hypothetical protein [Paraburkholderia sp. BL6669N2]|uniref:hypothetical protein n=1 Tax=Paraburkholderia sp. BL6669N2 TaxID=1938807 RepID=UPI000E26CE6E|nr:hypothetical protein [Paraburkholderia sp. BL6669N2]